MDKIIFKVDFLSPRICFSVISSPPKKKSGKCMLELKINLYPGHKIVRTGGLLHSCGRQSVFTNLSYGCYRSPNVVSGNRGAGSALSFLLLVSYAVYPPASLTEFPELRLHSPRPPSLRVLFVISPCKSAVRSVIPRTEDPGTSSSPGTLGGVVTKALGREASACSSLSEPWIPYL